MNEIEVEPLDRQNILVGVVGSTAYGLNHKDSDIDVLGVFVTPTLDLVGLTKPRETFSSTNPDVTLHEVGKFCALALKGNPTVLELLFLDGYSEITIEGEGLVRIKDSFLGATPIRNAYIGYAKSQIKRLNDRGDFGSDLKKRYAKHARHCFRLLLQAEQLLQTGDMNVKVTPEQREFLFSLGERSIEELTVEFDKKVAFLDGIKSTLPEFPDDETVNQALINIRQWNLSG